MSAVLKGEIYRTPAGLCPECPLNSRMRVGARGNPEATLVILGEAPGGQELRNGLPFCGPSGQVLEQVLPNDFDINEQAFILNAMQCCPPKSKSQTKDKQLKYSCVNACRQGVQDLLWAHPRKVILSLGNWAAVHLLGDLGFKITKSRGEIDLILDPIRGTEVQLVYAMHPASLLHGRGSVTAFKDDVHLALQLVLGTAAMYGEGLRTAREAYLEPEYVAMETVEQVQQLERRIREQNRIVESGADLETSALSPWAGGILCEGIYPDWDDNVAHIIPGRCLDNPEYARAVDSLHAVPNARWVWQNGKFDHRFYVLDERLQVVPSHDDDTLLLSYALDEASKAHDLEEQAKNYLGAPNYKDALKQWVKKKSDSYSLVPEPVLFDYLAKDVKNTMLIKEITRQQVSEDADLEKLYTRTLMPASLLFARIELYGIQTDPAFVELNEIEILQDMDKYIDEISTHAGYDVNPNSPAEVARFLYDECGLRIKGKRPTDTAKETLDKLPLHPAVKLIKGYRRSQKMLSTYVKAIEKFAVNGIVHTTYKQQSTTTGRPASAEPNVLNIPREARYRRMYRAREGYVLIEGDYNTAELRGLAVLSGDRFLTGVFLDDTRNLHDEVSVEMYGADFTPDQRIRAKAINFGIPYGRSAFSIAEEFDISPTEASRLISTWFMRAPEAHAFIMKCRAAPIQGRTLVTPFGRKRRPGLVSQERLNALQNEFANFFMQSIFSNDFATHSCLRMEHELLAEGAHIVNIPYDSVVVECPDDPAVIKRVAEILRTYMQETPKLWISTPIEFVVDMKCGTHWGLLKGMK